jgi:hypothetical protein
MNKTTNQSVTLIARWLVSQLILTLVNLVAYIASHSLSETVRHLDRFSMSE